jgi:glycosyltransferase involved in cell wall biosynthesis
MNILFLSDEFPPNHIGGAGVVAYRLAKKFSCWGHAVEVITSVRNRRLEGESLYQGIRVYNLYSDYNRKFRSLVSIRNFPILKKLKKLLPDLKIKPDIIHSHNVHNYLSFHSLELISSFFKVPIVITAHEYGLFCAEYSFPCSGNDLNHIVGLLDCFFCMKHKFVPFRRFLTRRYIKRNCAQIISVSNAVKAALEANGYSNVKTVYNGIDLSEYVIDNKPNTEIAIRWGVDARKVVLCPGGRFDFEKGGRQLIRAMGKVIRDIDACLLVPGRKNYQHGQLVRFCQEEGIEDRVKFIGWLSVEGMKTAYSICNVSVTPSIINEAFGLGAIEAMAMKRPVVGTCYGAIPEIIEDGITGYIVDPFDINLMAKRIKELLNDPKKAESMGMAGYRRINKFFSLEKQAKETLNLYLALLDRKA